MQVSMEINGIIYSGTLFAQHSGLRAWARAFRPLRFAHGSTSFRSQPLSLLDHHQLDKAKTLSTQETALRGLSTKRNLRSPRTYFAARPSLTLLASHSHHSYASSTYRAVRSKALSSSAPVNLANNEDLPIIRELFNWTAYARNCHHLCAQTAIDWNDKMNSKFRWKIRLPSSPAGFPQVLNLRLSNRQTPL